MPVRFQSLLISIYVPRVPENYIVDDKIEILVVDRDWLFMYDAANPVLISPVNVVFRSCFDCDGVLLSS